MQRQVEVGAVLEGYMNVLRKSAENTTEQNLTLQLNIISTCGWLSLKYSFILKYFTNGKAVQSY